MKTTFVISTLADFVEIRQPSARFITCPDCDGEGKVTVIYNLSYETGPWDRLETCETCGGAGEIDCPHYNINCIDHKIASSVCLDCGLMWDENGKEIA